MIKILIYLSTYAAVVTLYNYEILLTTISLSLLFVLMSQISIIQITNCLVLSGIMTIATWTGVMQGSWQFNNAKYTIPVWLFPTWCLVILFISDYITDA